MTLQPSRLRGFVSKIAKLVRTILIALVVAFLVGFTIGTLLRGKVDKPVRYIGARDRVYPVLKIVPNRVQHTSLAVRTTYPGDVRYA